MYQMSDLYVFFDDSNQIVAVSGNKDASSSNRYAIFPEEDVAGFILGTMNMNDFVVRENRKTGKVTLEKKVTHEILIRTIDNTLYKLPKVNNQFQIKVLNNIENKELFFENDPKPVLFFLPLNIIVPTQNGLEKNAV